MMSSTRQSIIEYLERKPFASAAEISQALRTTTQNTRHHLSVLIDQGVVEATEQVISRKRGRPTTLYALSRRVHEHNLDRLASALLGELMNKAGDAYGEVGERTLALGIASRLVPGDKEERASLVQRLVASVQALNEMHYHAHWEAHPQAPRIILGHCPYLSILDEHPWLCQMDGELLGRALQGPVEQLEKLAPSGRGMRHCIFTVKGY